MITHEYLHALICATCATRQRGCQQSPMVTASLSSAETRAAVGRYFYSNCTLLVLLCDVLQVRGGVPMMPNLTRLELYDDTDLKLPGNGVDS